MRKRFIYKRKWVVAATVIVILAAVLYLPRSRSYIVMAASGFYEQQQANQQIALSIPVSDSAKQLDWYPKMLCYNDRGGYNRANDSADFQGYGPEAHASFYDTDSAYYASFFGAYVVGNVGESWTNSPEHLASVPRYDYMYLILEALGCPREKLKFDYRVLRENDDVTAAGSEGWVCYDLSIDTVGVAHQQRGFLLHDLQFGPSPFPQGEDFEPVTLYARVYAKYDELRRTQVMLYVMTPDQELLEATDSQLLSYAAVNLKN
jgi:hypothetical protein